MNGTVSVIIPTFNRSATLCKSIDSVIAQKYPILEIIIVDDASTDDTIKVLSKYDTVVTIARHENNSGASAARNTGIRIARGDYIAFLDSDDIWLQDKLFKQISFMKENSFKVCCTGFSCIYDNSKPAVFSKRHYDKEILLEDLVWGVYISPGTTLIAQRSVLNITGGYDESIPRYEDWEFLLRIILETRKIGYLNENLAIIYPSNGPSLKTLEYSIQMMKDKGLNMLGHQKSSFKRKFKAGLNFELAVAFWKNKKYKNSIKNLLKSFFYAPLDHHSIRMILVPWLYDSFHKKR